ncbi:MAG: UvrB/UvrC motif-containing protein, partial [Oscillospiraceae bacterium]
VVTPSMERAITETERRRGIQRAYNEKHGIVPTSIQKEVRAILEISSKEKARSLDGKKLSRIEREELIKRLTKDMKHAAQILEFEYAAELRDRINKLQQQR